jgi:hypothetical protein
MTAHLSEKYMTAHLSEKYMTAHLSEKYMTAHLSEKDFGLLNCSGNGMFFINILFCHLSCFYFAVLSFFMFLLCCPVIFHVSTLLPCHLSCFYFAALSFSCFYFAALSFPHS